MATTGTYTYNPALSNLVLNAYGRIQIRGAQLTTQHLQDAAEEAQLLLTQWANKGPNLWECDTLSYPLTAGVATLTLPAETVNIITAYTTVGSGAGATDRVIGPISQSEYAGYPNKALPGGPTSYWFNRQVTPTITLYPVPDTSTTYVLNIRRMRQPQDAAIANGLTIDAPYRFADAFVADLAHRLSRIWKPELEDRRKQDAKDAWDTATSEDTESVPIYISPGLSGYFD